MKQERRFSLVDLSIIVTITIVLSAILFPVFVRAKRVAMGSRCQSNMSRIGGAMMMYLNDWNGMYPTNRLNPPMNIIVSMNVPLSDPHVTTGDLIPYQYGVNWVEELYPYIERVVYGDTVSVWKCPAARRTIYGLNTAAVTYAFNANLVEFDKSGIKNPKVTMMCRELDRLQGALLKPSRQSLTSSSSPFNPFLNQWELGLTSSVKCRLHADGSHILFADGHVKFFSLAYFPQSCEWNATTNQWFNYVNLPAGDPRSLSIAVSP